MSNFETWWEREGQEFLYALNTTTDDDIKLVAEIAWKNGAYCAEQAEQEPMAWQGAEEWEPLAFQLCADENGEESCNELLWDGGVIPEPWGERWLKYEDEAKRMIEYVRKYAEPVRTKDLSDDEILDVALSIEIEFSKDTDKFVQQLEDIEVFARAIIEKFKEKNK